MAAQDGERWHEIGGNEVAVHDEARARRERDGERRREMGSDGVWDNGKHRER